MSVKIQKAGDLLRIEVMDSRSPAWQKVEDFVSGTGQLFLQRSWRRLYPNQRYRLAVILNKNSEVIGCFHFYEYRKGFLKFIITPPYSPHIALVYHNPSTSTVGTQSFNKELIMLVADFFSGLKADVLDIQLPLEVKDTQPFTWKKMTVATRYTYILDLDQPVEKLWEQLSSEKRKSLNKAGKDGVEAKEALGSRDQAAVKGLVERTLERNGINRNREVLASMFSDFVRGNNSILFLAQADLTAIGATLCVVNGRTAVYLLGGFDSGNSHHGAVVSCIWQSILKARTMGLKWFDFEGSMDPGIERFFREFGGNLTPYFGVKQYSFRFKCIKALIRK